MEQKLFQKLFFKDIIKGLVFCFVILFCSAFFFPSRAFCYDTDIAHPNIAKMASELYNQTFDTDLTNEEVSWIEEGARQEDTPFRWMNHFYDPVHEKGLVFSGVTYTSAKNWANSPFTQTNYALGDKSWQRALDDIKKGDRKNAFKELGHTLHLIADMSVPAHTRNDVHAVPKDSFEEFVKNNWNSIAKNLKANYLTVDNLQTAFNDLANYSNNNFYSDDTIESGKYNKIEITNKIEFSYNNNFYYYNYSNYNNKEYKIFISRKKINWKTGLDNQKDNFLEPFGNGVILSDYSSILLPKAVAYSSGVIKLFIDETNKIETDKIALPSSRESWTGFFNRAAGSLVSGAEKVYDLAKNVFGVKDKTLALSNEAGASPNSELSGE
ncbi:MAG: hypothetical protein WC430_02495, partial [Patescibacteria group bacterium]